MYLLPSSPQGPAYSHGNRQTAIQLSLQILWNPRGYCLGPRTAVHIKTLKGILHSSRCDRKSLIRISSSFEWGDGAEDPGNWTLPTNLLPRSQELLEPVPRLGWVRPELSSTALHWTHSLPVLGNRPMFHLLTTSFGRARGSGTQLTISFNEECADRWQQTFEDQKLHLTNRVRRSGCQHGTSECACPARSQVPDTLVPSPSPRKLIRSLTNCNFLHKTKFTLHSTCHYSNLTILLFPQSLARQRNPLFLLSWKTEPSTRSMRSWTPGAVVVSYSNG